VLGCLDPSSASTSLVPLSPRVPLPPRVPVPRYEKPYAAIGKSAKERQNIILNMLETKILSLYSTLQGAVKQLDGVYGAYGESDNRKWTTISNTFIVFPLSSNFHVHSYINFEVKLVFGKMGNSSIENRLYANEFWLKHAV
ncbi:hypothetical protein L9F63_016812, partial [Diploptera punctata]